MGTDVHHNQNNSSLSWKNCKLSQRTNHRFKYHRGMINLWLIVAGVVALISTGGGLYYYIDGNIKEESIDEEVIHEVTSGTFNYTVTEKGDVQSSSNIEIRCHVKAKGSVGTAILKICEEGTYVEKGDFLIQFDKTLLVDNLNQQEIIVANGEAAVIQAQSDLRTALAAFEEYTGKAPTEELLRKATLKGLVKYGDGTFHQELDVIDSEIFVAEENLRRSVEYLQYSNRMATKGYVTSVQLEADRFAVQKYKKELEVAKSKFDVLKKHTYKKMVGELVATIAKEKANLKSANIFYEQNTKHRDDLIDQIGKCTVLAPASGEVVYNNQTGRHGKKEFVVQEGATVRENQVVIRLPDPKQMEVITFIQETRINFVKPNALCSIRFDALPGYQFSGRLKKIDSYPTPLNAWNQSGPKKYNAYVEITETVPGLRPSQKAHVSIFVYQENDVLQVPMQSVVIKNKKSYCFVRANGDWIPRKVAQGKHSESFVIIEEGLQAGEIVSKIPRQLLAQGKAKLPKEKKSAASEPSQANAKLNLFPKTANKDNKNTSATGGGG